MQHILSDNFYMKKLLLLVLLCSAHVVLCFAQSDCEICGTWSGVYNQPSIKMGDNPISMQLFIRIRKNGQRFQVQIKEVSKSTGKIYYHPTCNIISANDNFISWHEDGPIDFCTASNETYYSVHNFFEAHLLNGSLFISQTRCILKYYDSNKNYLYEKETPPYKWMTNITTYKDDDNW